MLHEFKEKGLLYYTHYDSFKMLCIDESSDPEIVVTDISDPILFWQRYNGEKIAACSKCGKLFAKRSNRHSMCRSCFEEQRREKRKEYNEKYYKNKNSQKNRAFVVWYIEHVKLLYITYKNLNDNLDKTLIDYLNW